MFLGREDNRLEMERRGPVARMTDDIDPRIADGANHGGGVLVGSARRITERVNAGDPEVETAEKLLFHINISLVVENIQLDAKHQLDSIHLARHAAQVLEIDRRAGARNAGSVLGDAQQLKSLLGGGLRHLLHRAESVSTRDGMRVDV